MKDRILTISIFIFCIFVSNSCSKDDGIEEPIFNNYEESNLIGDFEFTHIYELPQMFTFMWTDAKNAIYYDVLINDTLSFTKHKNNFITIEGLVPETSYKITVRAVDENYKSKSIQKTLKTKREAVQGYLKLDIEKYDYYDYNLHKSKPTRDGGYIVQGFGRKYLSDDWCVILVKTDKDYQTQWHINIDLLRPGHMQQSDVSECGDGGFIVTDSYSIFKISKGGVVQWKNEELTFQNFEKSYSYLYSGVELTDGSFICVGSHYNMAKDHTTYSYFSPVLMKFSQNGEIVWTKYIEASPLKNKSAYRCLLDETSLNIFGVTTETFDGYYVANAKYTLWKVNNEGELLNEYVFTDIALEDDNKWHYEREPHSIFSDRNGGYYLMGYRNGARSPYEVDALYIMKINNNGGLQWIHDPITMELDDGVDEHPTASKVLENNTLLIASLNYLSYTDDVSIREISPSDGSIICSYTIHYFPMIIGVNKNSQGLYELITTSGEIYFMDLKNGYLGEYP